MRIEADNVKFEVDTSYGTSRIGFDIPDEGIATDIIESAAFQRFKTEIEDKMLNMQFETINEILDLLSVDEEELTLWLTSDIPSVREQAEKIGRIRGL